MVGHDERGPTRLEVVSARHLEPAEQQEPGEPRDERDQAAHQLAASAVRRRVSEAIRATPSTVTTSITARPSSMLVRASSSTRWRTRLHRPHEGVDDLGHEGLLRELRVEAQLLEADPLDLLVAGQVRTVMIVPTSRATTPSTSAIPRVRRMRATVVGRGQPAVGSSAGISQPRRHPRAGCRR